MLRTNPIHDEWRHPPHNPSTLEPPISYPLPALRPHHADCLPSFSGRHHVPAQHFTAPPLNFCIRAQSLKAYIFYFLVVKAMLAKWGPGGENRLTTHWGYQMLPTEAGFSGQLLGGCLLLSHRAWLLRPLPGWCPPEGLGFSFECLPCCLAVGGLHSQPRILQHPTTNALILSCLFRPASASTTLCTQQ